MEFPRPLYNRPSSKEISEAYKWWNSSGLYRMNGWATIRYRVWQYLEGRTDEPDMDWDLPPEHMVTYFRIVRKMTVKQALEHLTKRGYIKEESNGL